MMNLGNIIVFAIIVLCVFLAVRGFLRKIRPPKGGNSGCSTCKGCPVSDACHTLKKDIE